MTQRLRRASSAPANAYGLWLTQRRPMSIITCWYPSIYAQWHLEIGLVTAAMICRQLLLEQLHFHLFVGVDWRQIILNNLILPIANGTVSLLPGRRIVHIVNIHSRVVLEVAHRKLWETLSKQLVALSAVRRVQTIRIDRSKIFAGLAHGTLLVLGRVLQRWDEGSIMSIKESLHYLLFFRACLTGRSLPCLYAFHTRHARAPILNLIGSIVLQFSVYLSLSLRRLPSMSLLALKYVILILSSSLFVFYWI